jgi:hypothetical protein
VGRRGIMKSGDDQVLTLSWIKEKSKRRLYVLRHGSSEVARLSWNKMFGTLATGQFGDKRWTFKRSGFLRSIVTVRVEGTEEDVAKVEFRWNGAATIRTSQGDEIKWNRVKRWRSEWTCIDQAGSTLLSLGVVSHFLSSEFQLQTTKYDFLRSRSPYLLILPAYMTILTMDDEAAACATTAVVAATS